MTDKPLPAEGQVVWSELCVAQQAIGSVRVAVRALPDRVRILDDALGSGAWQQRTAFEYLKAFPEDVPALLRQLLELSTSIGWLPEVIALFQRAEYYLDEHHVGSEVTQLLGAHNNEHAPEILNLLSVSGLWQSLEMVVDYLMQSGDQKSIDIAHEYTDQYWWAYPSQRERR